MCLTGAAGRERPPEADKPTTALTLAMGRRSPIMTARYSEFADSERGFDLPRRTQPRPIPFTPSGVEGSEAEGRRWAFARADIARGQSLPSSNASALTD